MKQLSRRAALLSVGGAIGWGVTRSLTPALPDLRGVPLHGTVDGALSLNDASGLSPTPIAKHLTLRENAGEALITHLQQELLEAREAGRPVNVGAARHSMGGQAIPRQGTAITFDNTTVELDSATGLYRVHAGTRWSQVIAALDPLGWSPKVMQSNNDFGVAATFSVNAHGWPVPHGPMGATVRSLRMILPDGSVVTCSRDENEALFDLAMGGYGLVGILLDLEVQAVPNQRLVPRFEEMSASSFASAFQLAVLDPEVTMAYGRLNVERERFFEDALLITYRATEDQEDLPPAPGSGWMAHVASRLYRAQLGNETMKSFRWWNETTLGPALGGGETTRNSLINEPVATLDDRDATRTDILHEYFIGFDQFDGFLQVCRDVIPASYQEFLNVTLRYVAQDDESVLAYATVPRIAAVMSFSQEMSDRAEADMQRMTQDLIDGITGLGGSYYLPYRPHARRDQLIRAYPRAAEFAEAKRKLDPDLVLRNNQWDSYLGAL